MRTRVDMLLYRDEWQDISSRYKSQRLHIIGEAGGVNSYPSFEFKWSSPTMHGQRWIAGSLSLCIEPAAIVKGARHCLPLKSERGIQPISMTCLSQPAQLYVSLQEPR